MENILKKICKNKQVFIEKEKRKKSINFLIKNTSKKKKVNDFKKAFDQKLKKRKNIHYLLRFVKNVNIYKYKT